MPVQLSQEHMVSIDWSNLSMPVQLSQEHMVSIDVSTTPLHGMELTCMACRNLCFTLYVIANNNDDDEWYVQERCSFTGWERSPFCT